LRVWYVKRAVSRELFTYNQSFTLYDAGCGSGELIISLAKKYPSANFIGIDRGIENIQICSIYCRNNDLTNVDWKVDSIEKCNVNKSIDIITCITVMQYIEKDTLLLSRFYDLLNENGSLVLYIPINLKRIFPIYDLDSSSKCNM